MFSQGRGAGLSPGTSAHNPSAFSEPAKETERGQKEGEESEREAFPGRENLLLLWQWCQWLKWWRLKETVQSRMQGEGHSNLQPLCKVGKKKTKTTIFATVHLYHTTRFTCQGLLGFDRYPSGLYPWEKMDCCMNQAADSLSQSQSTFVAVLHMKYTMHVIFQHVLFWYTHLENNN